MASKTAKPASRTSKPRPVALVARDYIILADGTRYERGEVLPADVAADLPASFIEKVK